ncbi:flagellar hook-length control protein FliK [Bowmanella yangjiangensis]|uniref:Flagellar hook-length control protein FliK n=1 Tax=Bowmanella yangjiangensis TaxID=2811230 RepID=A0ABS3CXY4_9ALTE|nr:flagellar hook-length control protein FliK [Bowmanella yangjiangensis]MBN7821246.1 flagellar hook-length control protein FliK [Bowmanella yangjiangensis]
MSELQLSPQSALLNAMRQMQQAGLTLPDNVAAQLSQVEVKLLPGNQLLLSLANRQVVINAKDLQGKLQNGQLYQLLTDNKDGGRLLFYTQTTATPAPTSQQSIPLGGAVFNSLLTAIVNNQQGLPDTLSFPARVLNQQAAALILDVQGQTLRLSLSAPLPELRPGQPVEVNYQRQQGQWTIKIDAQNVKLSESGSAEPKLSSSGPSSHTPSAKAATAEWPIPKQSTELFRFVQALSKPQNLDLAQLKQWVGQLPIVQQKSLMPLLLGPEGQVQSVKLQWPTGSQPELLLNRAQPVATLVVGKPVLQQMISSLQPTVGSAPPVSAPTSSAAPPTTLDTSKLLQGMQAPATPLNQVQNPIKVEGQVITGQPSPTQLQNGPVTSGTVQEQQPSLSKTQQAAQRVDLQDPLLQKFQDLGRRLMSQQDSPARLFNQIDTALADNRTVATDTGKLLQQLSQHLKQSLPQGNEQDAAALRSLLTTPALNLTPLQLVTTNSSQGLVGALVTLLQVALTSRLANQSGKLQAGQGQKLLDGLNALLETVRPSTSSTPVNQRNLSDMAQLEQRHQLLNTLGRLLGGHSHAKLRGVETQLQGQDSFYYNLPIAQGEVRRDIELLIRREPPPDKKSKSKHSADRQWNLTMKLEIGELGGLLAKARLYQTEVELDFYAANAALRDQVIQFIPHLKKRLTALGIQVNHSQCQLGKIPEHLQQRPYQVFETQA